jgi:hypothetical protein
MSPLSGGSLCELCDRTGDTRAFPNAASAAANERVRRGTALGQTNGTRRTKQTNKASGRRAEPTGERPERQAALLRVEVARLERHVVGIE